MSVPNAENRQVASGGDNKVDKRVCICGSALCSEIQGYLDQDDKRRGYIQIPPLPKENDGRRGAAKRLEALKFVYRRLKTHLNLSELPIGKRLYITRLHFPEERLAERKRRMIWYFKGASSDNRADVYKCADGSVITFNAPTVSHQAIRAIYDEEVQSDRKKRRLSRSARREAKETLQRTTPVERNLFKKQSPEDTRRVVQQLSLTELAKAHDEEVRKLQNENARLQHKCDEIHNKNRILSSKINQSTAEASRLKIFKNGLLMRCGELENAVEESERELQKLKDME